MNLQSRLEPMLREKVAEAVELQRERMSSFYAARMQEELAWQTAQLREQMQETLDGIEHALTGDEQPQVWEELAALIANLEQVKTLA
ncbi:hypothetical protein ACFQY3_16495 [Paenibacillus farraposensis]